ncbi:MAG: flavodoxin family protein [Armatimonadota bacterium]
MTYSSRLVLGVSGSAIDNGNTDRAVKAALAATGCRTEFLKLSEFTIAPCRACLGCVRTNRCVINDDGRAIAERVKAADALIIGGYAPYSSLDARTKAFIERLYPLRHHQGFMRGKPGGAVVTHAVPAGAEALPPAAEMAYNAIMFYMMEEGMQFLGAAHVLGNVPCVSCGFGDECEMSGIKMLFGGEATVDGTGIKCFERQPEAQAAAEVLGRQIGEALRAAV